MDHPLPLRLATADDIPAISALVREAYGKWVPVIGREPLPMRADYALAVARHRIDLYEHAGQLAGLIETIPQDDHLLIENVAVAPACQGQGLGRRLLAHAEHLAQARGQELVRLYTNAAFAQNVAFYQRQGYLIEREEPFMGGMTVYFWKRLAPVNR